MTAILTQEHKSNGNTVQKDMQRNYDNVGGYNLSNNRSNR